MNENQNDISIHQRSKSTSSYANKRDGRVNLQKPNLQLDTEEISLPSIYRQNTTRNSVSKSFYMFQQNSNAISQKQMTPNNISNFNLIRDLSTSNSSSRNNNIKISSLLKQIKSNNHETDDLLQPSLQQPLISEMTTNDCMKIEFKTTTSRYQNSEFKMTNIYKLKRSKIQFNKNTEKQNKEDLGGSFTEYHNKQVNNRNGMSLTHSKHLSYSGHSTRKLKPLKNMKELNCSRNDVFQEANYNTTSGKHQKSFSINLNLMTQTSFFKDKSDIIGKDEKNDQQITTEIRQDESSLTDENKTLTMEYNQSQIQDMKVEVNIFDSSQIKIEESDESLEISIMSSENISNDEKQKVDIPRFDQDNQSSKEIEQFQRGASQLVKFFTNSKSPSTISLPNPEKDHDSQNSQDAMIETMEITKDDIIKQRQATLSNPQKKYDNRKYIKFHQSSSLKIEVDLNINQKDVLQRLKAIRSARKDLDEQYERNKTCKNKRPICMKEEQGYL
ncbi:UNKNOWN [Stylonychia lemnae]|uniref:Uncharacterized protein n=1 Tax=Stylonychia lemnae TaxID=5949 RepID=A0A078ATR8_STYLE|nr:UNKNOWN [Stylonychia lemnae]|eukprot:CDW84622.1 UNKNOWN [Stylonychia lemnae]